MKGHRHDPCIQLKVSISVLDPDPQGSALVLPVVDWIRILESKSDPQKSEEISCSEVLDVFLRAKGFPCS
jgi:hypothetical protein